jgi:hypothetical protein
MKEPKKTTPPAKPVPQPKPASAKTNVSADFFSNVEGFLFRNRKILFWVAMIAGAAFGLMMFDGRMSFATDDSTYLMNALAFLKNGSYPTFQGALYPLTMALLIKVLGYKIILLKFFSLIFLLLQIWVYYKAFIGRVPNFILFCGLFVIPFNAYILAYASSTFTESFFMLIQALCFLAFFRLIDKLAESDASLKNTWKQWLFFGFCFFLLSITKNVTIVAAGIAMLYFLLRKEWKYAAFAIAAFLIFRGPYQVIAKAVYGNISSNQTEMLLRVDFNDPSKGTVDAADLSDRFFTNFGQYITTHTFKLLGLRGSGVPSLYTMDKIKELREPMDYSWGYALIFLLLTGVALYHSFKKNKYIFFTILYVVGISFLTFVAIHTFWNQDRYMVVFLPLFLSSFLYALYALAQVKWKALQPVVIIIGVICLLVQLGTTMTNSSKKMRYTKKYLGGDLYAAMIPMHTNYAKMAQYIDKNVPDSVKVLASKPEEAVAYSGKMQFTRVPSKTDNADSISAFLKKTHTGYVIISVPGADGGRSNPPFFKTYPLLQAFAQKYPARLQEVHTEGDVDQVVLYKIND